MARYYLNRARCAKRQARAETDDRERATCARWVARYVRLARHYGRHARRGTH